MTIEHMYIIKQIRLSTADAKLQFVNVKNLIIFIEMNVAAIMFFQRMPKLFQVFTIKNILHKFQELRY